ncbi:short-chain dehydrogenase/reductase SDR [Rhizorhabdus wittichii RW1]|uniref:Short-chain dehydrogenase/reductase SDR n=1 Tax=Rhizorhabdus wittichii (strain DSM 6014 / CCUG 31198 / JCM 15750 / NBRC 105917 / EY 4224 / RW1) TaxID=392499 RepID=A0A9J9LDE3_RHIWR|nr:short-chain dehydrogenase/reductase SDR [Rhizorhabdus wittichii RW1]
MGMSADLAGLVAVVTGAAGGIGAATAAQLAERGARVLAVDRKPAPEEMGTGGAGELSFLQVDLMDEDAPDRIVDHVRDRFGALDILVNNAALIGEGASIERFSLDDLRRTFEVNVIVPFRLCAAATPLLKQSGQGRIVNVGSVNSIMASKAGASVYVASKHAIAGLTKALAAELGPYGITANYVLPGPTLTPMSAALGDAWREHYASRVPMGRLLEPDDIAGGIGFLVGAAAAMVNGHGLAVDGGMLAVLA